MGLLKSFDAQIVANLLMATLAYYACPISELLREAPPEAARLSVLAAALIAVPSVSWSLWIGAFPIPAEEQVEPPALDGLRLTTDTE